MIEPSMKLPLKDRLSRKKYLLIDANENVVCTDVNTLADCIFIVDACNHIKEAIKLLTDIMVSTKNKKIKEQISDYLKSIDYGK